jgi:putative membrane protein
VIVAREGWLTRRAHLVPHARVQSLRLSQGPLQRWLRLADLHVDSPPGPVRVRGRHRDEAEARALLESESRIARAARLGCRAADRS